MSLIGCAARVACVSFISGRPYGELGSVERANVCCLVGFTSNLSEGGGQAPIIPGNCCETALVDEIVRELKARWVAKLRGMVKGCVSS